MSTTAEADLLALQAAIAQLIDWEYSVESLRKEARGGLTAEWVARLVPLAEHAVRHRTAITEFIDESALDVTVRYALLETVAAWVRDGLFAAPVAVQWAALLASDSDRRRFERLRDDFDVELPPWRDVPLGHLVYAAGLSKEEAAVHHAAGALDPSVLRTMAAMRGYRLPASP